MKDTIKIPTGYEFSHVEGDEAAAPLLWGVKIGGGNNE